MIQSWRPRTDRGTGQCCSYVDFRGLRPGQRGLAGACFGLKLRESARARNEICCMGAMTRPFALTVYAVHS